MSHADRQIVVGDRGRVVLPADVRASLGLEAGSRMLLSTERDGSLRLRPYRSVADQGRGMLAGLAPAGESMVDALLAERRREAAGKDLQRNRTWGGPFRPANAATLKGSPHIQIDCADVPTSCVCTSCR